MAHLLILLLLLPVVWGVELQNLPRAKLRPISNKAIRVVENIREEMPCGFAKYGIPPLAPLQTDHQQVEAFGEVNNFRLDGLNDFNILKLHINAAFKRVAFKFNWNNIRLQSNYNVSLARDENLFKRSAPIKFSLANFTLSGLVKYHLHILSGKLSVKELKVAVALDEVKSEISGLSENESVNKKLNRLIEEWIMIAVNDNNNKAAELISTMMVPLVNDMLKNMALADILAIMTNKNSTCRSPRDLDDTISYFDYE